MPIFKVPKRRDRNKPNQDVEIVGGNKITAANEGEVRTLSSASPAKSVKIESKSDREEIPVQSHTRSRPKRNK